MRPSSADYDEDYLGDAVRNCDGCPSKCDDVCNGETWGGKNSGTPVSLLRQTFKAGKMKFRKGSSSTKTASVKGGDVGDAPDGEATIYLYDLYFDDYNNAERAAILVHELMHTLGADEYAAYKLTPSPLGPSDIGCESCG